MIPSAKKQYTYSDYDKLPEGSPYQLIGGELIMTPSSTPYHQFVSSKLFVPLSEFVVQQDLGIVLYAPLDVYLSETETYQPDIVFISKANQYIIGNKRIEAAPDLVVEILSPSTAYYDLKYKKNQYELSGVKEYWIIDPDEKSIEIYQSLNGKFELTTRTQQEGYVSSVLLRGFQINLSDIF